MRVVLSFAKHGINKFTTFSKLCRHLSYVSSNDLSYYHYNGKKPLRSITIGGLLDAAANTWPERKAVVSFHENVTLTFSALRKQANQLGASLLKLGLKKGDRLAVLGPNTVHWYVTMLAAAKAGLILVTMNPAYRTGELKYCLKKVGVKAIIMDEMFKTQNYYEMILEIDPNLIKLKSGSKINSPELPDLEYVIVETDKELPGAFRYKDVIEAETNENDLHVVNKLIQPEDAAVIQYSSGTTGQPKAATLSHFGMVNNAHFFGERHGFHKMHHVLCLQVPLFHIFGTVLGGIIAVDFGTTLVFPGPSFKPETSLISLRKEKFTAIYGTPTMYSDLLVTIKNALKNPNDNDLKKGLENFKIVVSGGALCAPKLFNDIAETFNCPHVCSAYGMSETSPIMFTNTPKDTFEQRSTTVGCVADHAEVKIVDKDGRMVPFDTPGEAWFRTYATMLKYWNDEDKTKETITSCGWLKSGDLMVLSQDGYGKVVGRLKDVVIRGGENIFPSEVENFLQNHSDISEVHVYGISDKRMGEEVCATIKLKPGAKVTEYDIKEFCKGKIAHFKIPRYVRFLDDLPKTASGKIKKYVLKEMMEKEIASTNQ